MTSSGTNNFFLDNADIISESFDRCGIRPTSLTRQHMLSAVRSLNLALSAWGNLGVNLWEVDLQIIPLVQGVSIYTVPSNTVSILDVYRETYQLTNTTNLVPAFSTIATSPIVTVTQANTNMAQGSWMQILIPVAVGGIVLYGPYTVTTALTGSTYQITAVNNATSTVSGGVVPSFTSASGSSTFTVNLTNHAYAVGESFNIQVSTTVGGVPLLGAFPVQSVPNANSFTITGPFQANSIQTIFENSGLTQIDNQNIANSPIDQTMKSISRSEYASYPNKLIQGTPTVYWFDRLSPIPQITVWQTPDNNGPYSLKYYRMKRVQDAAASMGQTPDIPYLFLDALCADLAARLARKYAPQLVQGLAAEAKEAWMIASTENREYVDLYIRPDLGNYWRI